MTTLIIYSKIKQALSELNLIWKMFQINLILKKCMRKKSNVNHEIKLKKAICHRAIPAKILNKFCDLYFPIITETIKCYWGDFPKWIETCWSEFSFLNIGLYEQSFKTNLMIIWKINSLIFLLVFERVLVRNTHC